MTHKTMTFDCAATAHLYAKEMASLGWHVQHEDAETVCLGWRTNPGKAGDAVVVAPWPGEVAQAARIETYEARLFDPRTGDTIDVEGSSASTRRMRAGAR